MDRMKVVKAVEVGPLCSAPEWALRQGGAIAERHIPRTNFQAYAALANDIAQVLYDTAPPIFGGRNMFGAEPPKP